MKENYISNSDVFVEEGVSGRELARYTVDDFMQSPFNKLRLFMRLYLKRIIYKLTQNLLKLLFYYPFVVFKFSR